MENDPLRWHGGIKISMAVAFNDALKGLEHQLHTVSYLYLIQLIWYEMIYGLIENIDVVNLIVVIVMIII